MKYPFIRQKDLKDCGCCCLLMITRYFGGSVSMEYLREVTKTNRNGVSALNLIEGSSKLGFSSYGVRGTVTELKKENLPCIAHVVIKKSYEHFIVIYDINHKKKTITIADSNNRHITKISFSEFNKISTNNYILLKPNRKIKYVEKNQKFDNFFKKLLFDHKSLLLKIFTLSLCICFSQIFLSFQFKILLEYVIDYNTKYNLLLLTLIFVFMALIKEISNYRRNKISNELNCNLEKSLLNEVYNHILSLPYLYYKNRTTGEIVSRINDLNSIRDIISNFFVSMTFDIFLLIASIIVLVFLSSKLTIIILISIILLVLVVLLFNKSLEDKIADAKQSASELNSYLVETISGIETIKNQNIEQYIKNKFLLKNGILNRKSRNYNILFIVEDSIKNIITSLSNLGILVIGTLLVLDNQISLATLITFITLSNYVFDPISTVMNAILSFKEAKISYNRIKELYEIDEEEFINKRKINNIEINDININNLTYSYNNTDNIIKNINLDIPKGSKVLIYGDSGSGKSTMAKIICGLLKCKNKKVFLNNIDINKYSLANLRKNICYVTNNDKLFNCSIYNNIVLDKENIDNLENIFNICDVDEFVNEMPLNYDTLIEENGFNLSGGQKQRIILARSLLKNADVYIMDEALNQVDIIKERKILEKLFKEYNDKTFIYISHRFHNQDLFNQKIEIKDGECINAI